MKKGILRSYTIDEKGKERIFMFAPENWIINDNTIFAQNKSAQLFIDALEDTEVEIMNARFFNKTEFYRLLNRTSVLQERIIMLMSSSALVRYQHFLKTYPDKIKINNLNKTLEMINKSIVIMIGFSFCSCHINKKKEANILHTFPFTLTEHNNISIKAVINKKDTIDLMFHTAASSLDLTRETTKKINSINWDNETKVNTWGGDATSRTSKNNSLEINGIKWDNLTIWENENSGPTTDGKFGPNLFTGKVIGINYDEHVISLHKTVPNYCKDYMKLPISTKNGMMFIECISTIEGENYSSHFLIHSGFGGTVLYDDSFVSKNKIGERVKINSQQELKDSHGNILITKQGEIPLFTIGNLDFVDMPIGFFEGAIGRRKMSVLGGDILKRFNIIIDSKREAIYIKPNQLLNIPFK